MAHSIGTRKNEDTSYLLLSQSIASTHQWIIKRHTHPPTTKTYSEPPYAPRRTTTSSCTPNCSSKSTYNRTRSATWRGQYHHPSTASCAGWTVWKKRLLNTVPTDTLEGRVEGDNYTTGGRGVFPITQHSRTHIRHTNTASVTSIMRDTINTH